MKKVLVVIGTRPEAIKLAPVVHQLKNFPKEFDTKVCLTGQHQEMLYQAIQHFDIEADYDLKLMTPGQSLSELTSRIVVELQKVIDGFPADVILVQGDTTSAFIGGLVGYYNRLKVGHVEAGLRTDDKYSPFPEEVNRRLVGVLADYHFAPTQRAEASLLKENTRKETILVTGNTVVDALLYTLRKIEAHPPELAGDIKTLIKENKRIVLITGHRRENFGQGFENICRAIADLALTHKDTHFIYPVHLNPNVQQPVYSILGSYSNVYLIQPLSYVPFVHLMNSAYLILTDSGGIQEEAPTLGKPVLVMREVTERQEAIDSGVAKLVGTSTENIFREASLLLENNDMWKTMANKSNPYGDGTASEKIVNFLRNT